ncbi:MAG: hypothetical protein LBK99_10895 [Opitutaceae bacterium]|jgi:hypothetical protein|nr:hypothetical protein [Opitutaceae bacterium]
MQSSKPVRSESRERGSFRADAEETNLWWRVRQSGVEVAYFRSKKGGKDSWSYLGELEPRRARAIIRERRRTIGEAELLRRLGAVDVERDLSKVKDLFAAYRAWFAGTPGEAATMEKNLKSFIIVLRRGAGAGEEDSLAKWCPDTLRNYEAESIKAVRARFEADARGNPPRVWSREEQDAKLASTLRTIAATVRQARSLFAKVARHSVHYRELVLPPDLEETMAVAAGDKQLPGYRRPSASVVQAVVQGIRGLRESNPGMWLAAMLEVVTGARRGTLVHARWDWFVDHGTVEIESGRRIVMFEIRVAKGGESNVPVYWDDYQLLLEARAGDGVFIVPGKAEADRLAVLESLVPFLRGLGLDRRQPNHELRKLFADSKRKAHGAEETTAALGHSTGKLLKYYTETGASRAVSLADVLDPERAHRERADLERQLREMLAAGEVKERALAT